MNAGHERLDFGLALEKIDDLAVAHLENGPYENEAYQAVHLCREIMRACAEARKALQSEQEREE